MTRRSAAPDRPPRVAVVGARGIGRHHANWWTLEGAEVCAIAGTSAKTLSEAAAVLEADFGFAGPGYTHLERLLEREQPDIVDVCSPPPEHATHVRMALEAGCDVLCEKPFVLAPDRPPAHVMDQARELLALATAHGRHLGVCTQYAVGVRQLDRWRREAGNAEPVNRFHCTLRSPAHGRPPDPRRVWLDLGPHPISMLFALAGPGELAPGTLELDFDGYRAEARFTWDRPGAYAVDCVLQTGNAVEAPLHMRAVTINGYACRVEGHRGEDGVYGAAVTTPNGVHLMPDFMRLLIRGFLKGEMPAPPAVIQAELQLLLDICGRAP